MSEDVKKEDAPVEEEPKTEDAPEEAPEDAETEKALKDMLAKTVADVKAEAEKDMADMKAKFEKELAEHNELKEKRAGLYKSDVAEKRKDANNRLRKFFRALVKGDFQSLEKMQDDNPLYQKELTTGTGASPYGGYVVDAELDAEIRHLITEYGVARREMTVHELTKNTYKVNELATDLTVAWADTETASLLSTQFVLGQGTLSIKRLYAIVTMTNTLLEDSEIDLLSFTAERVAEGMAEEEDKAFFKGDGTSTYGSYTGLLENSSLNEVTMAGTTFASIDADDLIDMVDATPAGAHKNAKFYMHRTILSYIRKLKDSQNQYIYQTPSEKGPATIWGYPVVLVEAMPSKTDTAAATSFVLFGDLKKGAVFGYKGGIRAEMFRAGTVRNVANDADINLITSDRTAVRFIERVGYVTVLENAVTKLTSAASA